MVKRVGEILKSQRERKGLSLKDIHEKTKIRLDFLECLENGKYEKLPDEVYVIGFIRNYADTVGLNPEKIIPFYRRESKKIEDAQKKNVPSIKVKTPFKLTPMKLITLAVSIALTAFFIILILQYRMFSGAPILIVDSPPDNFVTSATYVMVAGKTDKDASLQMNGEKIEVDNEGNFESNFQLDNGLNRIRVVATSKLGKKTIVERVVEKTQEKKK